MAQSQVQIVRFSKENPNWEKGLEGKYGSLGEKWGKVTVIKNTVFVVAYKGAKVSGYKLPEVYDGFLICSDGNRIEVTDSTFSLDLGDNVSAQGILQLTKDN
jgi:hypothetical protein